MTVIERFLKLVSFDTTSSEESGQHPSTPNQKVLGAELVRQMQKLGIQDARMDAFGYVYGTIPPTAKKPSGLRPDCPHGHLAGRAGRPNSREDHRSLRGRRHHPERGAGSFFPRASMNRF